MTNKLGWLSSSQSPIPKAIIELLSVAGFSFLGSFIFSLVTILLILKMYLPSEGEIVDGFGPIFIALAVMIPTWVIITIATSIYARYKFVGKQALTKRLAFGLVCPIVVTTSASGIASVVLFRHIYLL